MNTDHTDRGIMVKTIHIKDIELRTQRRRTFEELRFARQYYVHLCVGDTSRSTNNAKEANNCTSWEENFYFDGDDRSVIFVTVYRKHYFKKDVAVGSLSDTIGGALGRLRNGVLEDVLRKDASDASDPLELTIKFALAAEPHEEGNSDERQVTGTGETEMVSPPYSAPTARFLRRAVDTGTNILSRGRTFENTWSLLLKRIELFDSIVASIEQIHPYMLLTWSVISAANKVLVNQENRDNRIIRLVVIISDVFTFVHDAEPFKAIEKNIKTTTLLIQQVIECGYFITWFCTAEHTMSDIDRKILDYETKFRELKTAFLQGVVIQTEITVVRMNVDRNEKHERGPMTLDDVPYALGAGFEVEKGCLPGTREPFLREICDTLNDPMENSPQVCLLTGVAGSGKSAIAHTIARLYSEQGRLGSSYCFDRFDISNRNPKNLFSTIARDLYDLDEYFNSALWKAVRGDQASRTSQSPLEQVKRLVIKPSTSLKAIGPLVVVIDALDESGDQASRYQLLRVISEQIVGKSLPIRFLITARPETDILTELPAGPRIVYKNMDDIPRYMVDEDIKKFVLHSLCQYTELESSWPDQEWCRLLVQHSGQLFQWASTACNFIHQPGATELSMRKRFQLLTVRADDSEGVLPLDKLYALYQTILEQQFPSNVTRSSFREVMAIVLALDKPLSVISLSALLVGYWGIRDVIKPLGSVLDGVFDEEKPIRPLHTTFYGFLLDRTYGSIFHVHIQPYYHLILGEAMLACMQKMLRFNICDLKDSRVHNTAIPDLPTRVNKAIPPHLAHASQHWMNHLQHVDCTPELLIEVTLFFKDKFSYWLEVIGLVNPFSSILSALETCKSLRKWAKGHELATLASEAFQFVQVFTPVLRESTPHLYLSAMPQTPTGSPLHKFWANHLQKHVSVTSGHPTHWSTEVHALHGHQKLVTAVAYSPDGVYIVSGSEDMEIRIWNATTGQCITGPFGKHNGPVSSVAYSPDGTHIVSGSWDKTLRIWDASTGQSITGPFQGHADHITSVTYSPDGIHVASGSDDKTIRVWNTVSSHCVAGPFLGHTDHVTSITYSPDGTSIASGSWDNTIRIWNASTGQCVAGPFQGHTYWVNSIAYSPDGLSIVSGSTDKTIRIWSAITGRAIAGPFQGHTDAVTSVAYSPDGMHIISGSFDKTTRVWIATNGQSIGLLKGHTDLVTSVAYSPDGNYVISGSWDKTIRVWDPSVNWQVAASLHGHKGAITSVAYSPDGTHIVSGSWDKTIMVNASTGQSITAPFQGHLDWVTSIAYSFDGTYIVSGSIDKTIRIWDACTGKSVAGELQGHTASVSSVAFSPDQTHIVSGSFDEGIIVWNAFTGQCVAGPFKGHTNLVTSVAYSPSGNHIVSGSWDKTIRIWDAITGNSMAEPFRGHSDWVTSVAYSPDGSYIVSGSEDRTIRVWSATSGQCVAGPFKGHHDSVISVAYSPDGTYIVSGSWDKTIIVWNAITGQCVAGPLQGHLSAVSSLSYSADGNYIVTGSRDHTIKVWDVQELASLGPLYEKNGWIQSNSGTYFGWMAPWNRNSFHLPMHSLVISSDRTFQVDKIDRSLFGESWTSYWI